jgi:N-acetylglutamate synthase-like GNAT family acetyltransferase
MDDLRVVPLDISAPYPDMKRFDCGNEMINRFVQKSLLKRVKKHLSRAYVLTDSRMRFLGFYTLDTFSIHRELFELDRSTGLPPAVPVIKLGMLGIDHSLQGRGLGKRLLRDAFLKVTEVSRIAGCAGVYLLAEENAIGFYTSLGFVTLKDTRPTPLFLHIKKIVGSMPSARIRG